MNYRIFLFCISLTASFFIHGWKSTEAKGDQPIISGTLTTQEGTTFYVTNISIGRNREGSENIVLYDKPANLSPSEKGNLLTINPNGELTTTALEMAKIKKIVVPAPHTIWKWTNEQPKKSMTVVYDFIELRITWHSDSTSDYLLELGLEDTKNPIKIFCDVIDKKIDGVRQDGTLFCPGLTKIDVRKKGAPFQSIKELVFNEPCYKVPDNLGTLKSSTNDK